MKRQNIKSWATLAIAISLVISPTISPGQLAKAELTKELLITGDLPSGPKRSRSGRTSGASTRGNCADIPKTSKLIALIPEDDNAETTISSNPKFFVYIPKHEAKSAEFEITDESGNSVYFADLNISEISGIVELSVPNSVSLNANQEYTWIFTMVCDPDYRSGDLYVQGTIKKVDISSDLEKRLKNSTPIEQAEIYKRAKIWNEAIATLATLRNSNPRKWEELLTSIGLENIASEPFAPCCQLEAK